MTQRDLFDISSGRELRDQGMLQAVDNADKQRESWSDDAFRYLLLFLDQIKGNFMAEDVRLWALAKGLKTPPHRRAWGAIIVRALKGGFIERVGYSPVKTPSSHRTPASVWRVKGGI